MRIHTIGSSRIFNIGYGKPGIAFFPATEKAESGKQKAQKRNL
jgi:hypothetical protein